MHHLVPPAPIALAAALSLIAGCGPDPLPAPLQAMECPSTSEIGLVSSGHDVFEVSSTTIAAPCFKAGSRSAMAKKWKTNDWDGRTITLAQSTIFFTKTPQGRFVKTDKSRATFPDSAVTHYNVEATFQPLDERNRWVPPQDDRYRPVAIPTPQPFRVGTGPETPFFCRPQLSRSDGARCIAGMYSKHLAWFIRVQWRPAYYLSGGEIENVLNEAYAMVATHVLEQK